VQINREDLSRHYASISDEELLAIDPSELTEVARECYDREVDRRQLGAEAEAEAEPETAWAEADEDGDEEPDWLDTAASACSFQVSPGGRYAEDAGRASTILRDAGIPSRVVSEEEGLASVMVPGALILKASSVLDRDMFNEELEENWRTHFDHLTDEELRALRPDDLCAGLLDRAARLRRAYQEAVERRKAG
jgi:hypothetical protein